MSYRLTGSPYIKFYHLDSSILTINLGDLSLREALREIHEVHSNSITVYLPNQFAKQVEVIVLPVADSHVTNHDDFWNSVDQIREELERSGRTL